MGLSTTTTIFLFVICLCGGIAIGAIFSRLKKPPADPAPSAVKSPPPAKELPPKGLHAWRDATGQAWLEMDGRRLKAKSDLKTEDKQELLALLMSLRTWLEGTPPPQGTPVPQPARSASPPPAPLPAQASISKPTPPATTAEKPRINLKTIVEQIDDVLQEKLVSSPFAGLEIHLLEGPLGEVMVQIGSVKHAGVEIIPNLEIQALIRQSIADWEKTSK